MKLRIFLVLACAAFSPLVIADTSPRIAVADARSLMIQALAATNGEAHGILIGTHAQAISQRFGASAPIFIDVTTERRYLQQGCSRLRVQFSQDGVLLPGTPTPRKQVIEFGINYCRDALPPQSLR